MIFGEDSYIKSLKIVYLHEKNLIIFLGINFEYITMLVKDESLELAITVCRILF